MRVIRLKLKPDVKQYIDLFASRARIGDKPFVHDVYALIRLKGAGIPDRARTDALIEHYAKLKKVSSFITKAAINKRVQVLKSIATTAMFQRCVSGKSSLTETEVLESILTTFRKLHAKIQQSQCLTCHLLSNCEFGKAYGDKVKDILVVQDPDYTKKVNPSCPHLPEMEFQNQIGQSAQLINNLGTPDGSSSMQAAINNDYSCPINQDMLEQMLEAEEEALRSRLEPDSNVEDLDEDPSSSMMPASGQAGKLIKHYDTRHLNGVHLDAAAIDQLTVANLVIYNLSKVLETMLDKSKKGVFKNDTSLTKHQKFKEISSITDARKVIAKEHANDIDVFDAKLAKKQLIKKQQLRPDEKRQLLYLLVDTSGSMGGQAGLGGAFGFVSRAALAASFSIALSRRVCADGGMLFMRAFSGDTSELRSCRNAEQHKEFEEWIASSDFGGGGTNIPLALKRAYDDITTSSGEISKAEILIVTDAEDSIPQSMITDCDTWFEKVPLNVLDVVGTGRTTGMASSQMKKFADNYFKIDPTKNSFEGMIDLVGGKKKEKAKK
jgi:Mg-chelatase subunit ChlD